MRWERVAVQQHPFSVWHLLFYCNLMALFSPGASRQSPLYHMAIISIALLCDCVTHRDQLSHVTLPGRSRTGTGGQEDGEGVGGMTEGQGDGEGWGGQRERERRRLRG